ncbi:MAG: endonuclease/exonuclease/phosphatase family protein [Phycisphaerales bacterium]|nr:endonuclease/exonuclease/phosphatase family protein [Phycisphaerales bacterium]
MVALRWLLGSILTLGLVGCEKTAPVPKQPAPAQRPVRDDAPEDAGATQPVDEIDPAIFHRYGLKEPRQRTPGSIRIATYNVENLFDDKDDPNLSGRFEDIDDTKPVSQLKAVAETIVRIDADILAVEEIESLDALIEFRDGYLQGLGYEYVVSLDAGDERGIEQAVLSRFPIVEQRQWVKKPLGGVHPDRYGNGENWYAGQPIAFHRSPLMVTVEVPGSVTGGQPYALTLLAVHHKSGAPAGYWREAESKGVLEVIAGLMAENPQRNLVVLGDFNATPADRSFQMYLEGGLIDILGQREGPEWISHASGRRIDHILANQQAMDEILPDSAFILGTTVGPEELDWSEAALLPGYASDHYPVVVDVKVGE